MIDDPEVKNLDIALAELKIDFKLKAEILRKVTQFHVMTKRDDKQYAEKAKQVMIECSDLINECIIEYDKLHGVTA